ncbi:hypothetical protein LF65_01179 [Clostridium beijerinckii]|uniref:Uncharacterized protein n=1 Tax=Clostridium beijerinckii TaxID=1520 RepID=A0A0B5QLY8_CLOBE|nr:alginate lyase family protein [Clostridium beijerinckii]AJG97793.2 hypothetical protein LF65_01179 [Clostridium beijerinckii]
MSKISQLKSLSLDQILKKVIRKLKSRIYYYYRKKRVKNKGITLKDEFFYNFECSCKTILHNEKRNEYATIIESLLLHKSIINSADKICNHEFNLLGSGEKCLGDKIKWNEDFKIGFRWENNFYKNIKIVDLSNNADVKIPWELSRFQHIFTLGKAYYLTEDEKYALEFREEIEDWIEKNPIEMSVNWTCAMDVAIRAVNWICGYFFFYGSKSIDNEFWIQFNKMLYLHGRYIYKNLENANLHNGNHYLSDLAGLIWLGIYFGEFTISDNERKNNPKDWLKFAILEFENEMSNQVNKDGTNYEASTSYHRLVTEIFLFTTILCNKNNIYFSKEYNIQLEKMCEFIIGIIKPNGLAPIIGDADDGRFIILSNYYNWNRRDFRYILAIAGEYFDRDDFRILGKEFNEDSLWSNGTFKNTRGKVQLTSKPYFDGGYYVLRDKRIYCAIRCGELSFRGEGVHSHNDQLSIELNVDGEDFIIDPGTYVYTSDSKMRNLYRCTKVHNTLYIDGFEQNNFGESEADLFYMKEQSFGKCKKFNDITFHGEHYGYKEKCGVIHERKVYLYGNILNIEDKLIGDSIKNDIYLNFTLDHGVKINKKYDGVELVKNGRKILMKFNNLYSTEEGFISYRYGEKIITSKLLIKMENFDNKIEIIYI